MEDIILRYLNKTISPEDEEKLLAWLEESDSNRLEFMEVRRIWLALEYGNSDINKEKELIRFKDLAFGKKKPAKFRKIYYAISGIAASLIIGILVFNSDYFNKKNSDSDIISFVNNTPPPVVDSENTKLILSDNKVISLNEQESSIQYEDKQIKVNSSESISQEESSTFNQLQIPSGKRSSITFADGTKVWANAGTRLVYPLEFKKDVREIYVDGEIYLDVAHDANRPFIVKTSDLDIQVLGTKFNVTAYNSDNVKQVVLVSGSVNVMNKEKQKESLLSPNNLYEYANENIIIKDVDVDQYTSWINGIYIFDKESLKNVLKRLSKYYGVDIICDDESAVYLCSGKLNLREDMQAVLGGLSNSIPVSYEFVDNTYKIKIAK